MYMMPIGNDFRAAAAVQCCAEYTGLSMAGGRP